jgi:transcriptional regulator with XRE-family HTH domain
MDETSIQERLRRARAATGLDLRVLASRIGVRAEHLRAIEAGRFADLPPGIYGRSAVRRFAAACGLDPVEALAACEALLPAVEEPIRGLARLHAVPQKRDPAPAAPVRADGLPGLPGWRPFAAAAVDACVIGAVFTIAAAAAAVLMRVPTDALRPCSGPIALVALFLAADYFVWFGGLCGNTIGGRAAHTCSERRPGAPLTLHAIAAGTLEAATTDVRAIRCCGVWVSLWLRRTSPRIYRFSP